MQKNETLTFDDLISAFVEYRNYEGWHPSYEEVIDYYRKQLQLIKEMFGCDFDEAKKRLEHQKMLITSERDRRAWYEFNGDLTIKLFEDCIGLLSTTKTPFDYSGMMEGMPPKISRDLEEKYCSQLPSQIKDLETTYRDIAKDILMFLFPGIEKKKGNRANLYKLGLPMEEPELTDFF